MKFLNFGKSVVCRNIVGAQLGHSWGKTRGIILNGEIQSALTDQGPERELTDPLFSKVLIVKFPARVLLISLGN